MSLKFEIDIEAECEVLENINKSPVPYVSNLSMYLNYVLLINSFRNLEKKNSKDTKTHKTKV